MKKIPAAFAGLVVALGGVITTPSAFVFADARPSALSATPGNQQITASWTQPDEDPNGGDPAATGWSVIGYFLVISDLDGDEIGRKECTNGAGTSESCTVTGDIDGEADSSLADDLQNGVTYNVSVIPRWENPS